MLPLKLSSEFEKEFTQEQCKARGQLFNILNVSNPTFCFEPSEKISSLKKHGKNTRGSKFIGVSRNGSSWQVLFKVNKEKFYLCSVDD